MKKIVWFALVLAAAASTAQGSYVYPVYNLSFTKDATHWYLWAQAASMTDNLGLSAFSLDVVGQPGTTITSSHLQAPKYVNTTLGIWVGFMKFPSDGVNGVGISAMQSATETDGIDPYAVARVIQHIGQAAGSGGTPPNLVYWDVPCLLASGTYSGLGDFAVANTYGLALDPHWAGGLAGVESATFTPEPATMSLLGLGAMALLRRRR